MDDVGWQGMDGLVRAGDWDWFVHADNFAAEAGAPGPIDERDRANGELLSRWLVAEPDRPFFAVLDLLSAHFPYHWPEDAPVPFEPHGPRGEATFLGWPAALDPVMRNAYRNGLHHADAVLGSVLETLREAGLGDVIVVVTSDHGQSIGEHGAHAHGRGAWQEQMRVPLVVSAPGLAPGLSHEPVGLVDVMPTIFGLLGLPPHGTHQGFDLLDPATPRGRPQFFVMQSPMTWQESIVAGDLQYVDDFREGAARAFDLAADPGQATNLASDPSSAARFLPLREGLRAWHMTQLLYYQDDSLHDRFFPPRADRTWSDTQ